MSDDDLAIKLEDSAVWLQLKNILGQTLLHLPESVEKQTYLQFMSIHWPGHAPRSREMATMTSRMTLLVRERDRLMRLLTIPLRNKT